MTIAQNRQATMVSGFVESLQEPGTPYISPKRFSKALGVQVADLADLTGVHAIRFITRPRSACKAAELVAVGNYEAVLSYLRDLENGASGQRLSASG